MLRKEAAQVLPEMVASLFSYMDTALLELAKGAKSNAEQSEYFAAMSGLKKGKKGFGQNVANEILNQFDDPRDLQSLLEARKKANEERKAKSQKRIKLSLVNTEEFEDWLAVANIISRSERKYEQFQNELLRRMGMIVDSWSHSEANPLETAVFTYAFEDALQQLDLSKEMRQEVYNGYETNILPLFRKLYVSTTKILEDTGLFLDMDDDYVDPSTPKTDEEPSAEEVPAEPEKIEEEVIEEEPEPEQEDDEKEERPRRSRRRSSSRRRRRAADAPRPTQPRERRDQASSKRAMRRSEDVGEAIRSIYSTVRDLIGAKGGSALYDDEEGDADYFEAEEVQDLLSTLEDEIMQGAGRRMPVRERLLETASMLGDRRISPQTMQSLEVVESLVDTFEEDEMLSGNSKDWIRKLELTLGKVATRHDDFSVRRTVIDRWISSIK